MSGSTISALEPDLAPELWPQFITSGSASRASCRHVACWSGSAGSHKGLASELRNPPPPSFSATALAASYPQGTAYFAATNHFWLQGSTLASVHGRTRLTWVSSPESPSRLPKASWMSSSLGATAPEAAAKLTRLTSHTQPAHRTCSDSLQPHAQQACQHAVTCCACASPAGCSLQACRPGLWHPEGIDRRPRGNAQQRAMPRGQAPSTSCRPQQHQPPQEAAPAHLGAGGHHELVQDLVQDLRLQRTGLDTWSSCTAAMTDRLSLDPRP